MRWLTYRQLKSKDPVVRRKAAEQLGHGPARRLGPLRRALADSDPDVRRLAATAMGKSEDERRVEPLLAALGDPDAEVLKAAVQALKKVPGDGVTGAVAPLLRHADAGVRGHAAQALESTGWHPDNQQDHIWFLVAKGHFSRALAFGAAAVPALEAALNSSASSVCIGAIEALANLGDTHAIKPLLLALKSPDPAVCVAAIDALQRLGDSQVIEPLVRMLRQQNPQVRAAAVEALGRLRAGDALEHMVPLLKDSVWEVRRETAEALGRLNEPRAVKALTDNLSDGDADVREATAIALGNLGDRAAIGPLVLALKDAASGVRRIAAAALSRIDIHWNSTPEAKAAIEQLKSALEDEDSSVRHFVGQLLVSLGAVAPEAAPALEPDELLASSPAKRRKLAVSLFEAILCDPNRDLRQAAAEALGQMADERAQSALLRAQSDPDTHVGAAATQALRLLGAAVARNAELSMKGGSRKEFEMAGASA